MLLHGARAAALIGALLSGWSLNLRWGADAGLGAGPPMQWERQVVGATLLAALVLVASLAAGSAPRPRLPARLVALAAGLGAAAVVLQLRRDAARGFASLVEGPGWSCLAAGAGLALAAALTYQFAHRPAARAAPPPRRR